MAAAEIFVAAHFSIAYVNGTTSWLDLQKYVAGTERLPFQYRALPAWIMRTALHLPGVDDLASHASNKMAQPLVIVWTVLAAASTLWILHLARRAAETILPGKLVPRVLALTFMIPLYVDYEALANGYRLSYAYDLPSLALFLACFAAILYGLRWRMLVLFALASLSRETSVYLIAVFLLYAAIDAQGKPRPGLMRNMGWAAALALIWLLAKLFLDWLYHGNPLSDWHTHVPGPVRGMELQLDANVHSLVNPLQWPGLLSSVGWLWLPVFAFWRSISDRRLKIVIALGTPAVAASMLLVGRFSEPRIFGEMTIFYWMAALTLIQAQKVRGTQAGCQALFPASGSARTWPG